MEWLRTNSSEILFSSSMDSCSPPPLIIITDDEEEDSTSQPDVISISSSDDMETMVSGVDRIRDRSEAMTNENNFYKALEVASVRYACDEVNRIINLKNDNKERYVPSSSMVMHVLRWLSIDVIATCGNMHWRHQVTELVRKSMYERYSDIQGDADENMPNVTNSFCSIDWSDATAEGVQTSVGGHV